MLCPSEALGECLGPLGLWVVVGKVVANATNTSEMGNKMGCHSAWWNRKWESFSICA